MINDDTQEQPDTAPLTGEVGNQLRKAREAKGISITQVAESQHLRPSVIQAIEDGQYHKIGSELFLKGYVRAYAEQVGLNATSIIEKLDFELEPMRREAEEAHHDNPLENIERKKRQKRRIARWIILILLLAVLAVIGSRMVDTELYSGITGLLNKANTGAEETPPPSDERPAFGQLQEGDEDMMADGQIGAPPAYDAEAPADDEPAMNDAKTSADAVNDAAPESEPAFPDSSGGAASEPLAGSADESNPEAAETVVQAPEPEPEPEPEPATTGDVLTATFTADCWVSVKNAEGTTVVASLKRAGESLRYQGQGPFRIVLGAADAATLNFNDEVVDLSDYPASNNRVALTLGN